MADSCRKLNSVIISVAIIAAVIMALIIKRKRLSGKTFAKL